MIKITPPSAKFNFDTNVKGENITRYKSSICIKNGQIQLILLWGIMADLVETPDECYYNLCMVGYDLVKKEFIEIDDLETSDREGYLKILPYANTVYDCVIYIT